MPNTGTRRYDVVVVGAGPAGAAAAHSLANAGLHVAIVEKERIPRYKTCGGGLVGRARDLIPFDISAATEREFHSVSVNLLDADLQFTATRSGFVITTVMRDKFDALLAEHAVDAGAELVSPAKVTGIDSDGDDLTVRTADHAFRARFVVGADGATGVVARLGGWERHNVAVPALEHELEVPPSVFEEQCRTCRFDFGIVPNGYAWAFPKSNHLSVGVLSPRRGRSALRNSLDEYLERIGIREFERVQKSGFLIPLKPRPGPMARNRVLLVGDAAGLADPLTAEGISSAIQSGHLAAEALISRFDDPARVASVYHAALEEQILRELRVARKIMLFIKPLFRWPQLRTRFFRRFGQSFVDVIAEIFMGQNEYTSAFASPHNLLRFLRKDS